MTKQSNVVLAVNIVKSVRDSKNHQKALSSVLTASFPSITTAYSVDVYDGKEDFPQQVKELFKAVDTMRKGKTKEADLAMLRTMAKRWINKTFEGYRFSLKTGTKKSPDILAIGLIENKEDAGSKTNTSKGKEKGKSGTEVKATLASLMESNDWDVQTVFMQLTNLEGATIGSVVTEMNIFISEAKKG